MTAPLRVHQFSSGITSWAVAHLDIQAKGRDNVVLLFADTLVEHADNYRFLREASDQLGVPVTRVADGRTPWQVFRDVKHIGNSKIAPCSHLLKQKVCRDWLAANTDPASTVLYVGLDWTEPEREPAITRSWKPWRVEFPLMKPPYWDKDHWKREARKVGLAPPAMYRQGFVHANCGGACVRGGQAQWALLLRTNPALYAENEREENAFREDFGKDVAILRDRTGGITRPLPLTVLRRRIEDADEGMFGFDQDDWGGCGCLMETEDGAA